MNRGRGENANWGRRAVLRGVAALTGAAVGCGSVVGAGRAGERIDQQVDADLPPGVTLFDLDGDGEYDATVERAPAEMRDDAHPDPIHVTSGGRSTVDYAAAIAEPPSETTLADLDELSYDYYVRGGPGEGTDDADGGMDGAGEETGDADNAGGDGLSGPGETFLVVENDDGRHGAYFAGDGDGAREQWRTVDVLARVRGDGTGSGGWFEYTGIESGDDGQRFDDAVARFGGDARLVRVGVGRGDAVTPTTLDAFYGNLAVNGEAVAFPVSVADRVSSANPL